MEYKRNIKTLKNKTGEQIINKIRTMINNHERYKKSYFWTNTGNARSRRAQEFETDLIFILDGKKYEWNQSLSISCINFYWTSVIYVDGCKKNITTMRNLLK